MQSATIYCLNCGAPNDPQMSNCVQCGAVLVKNVSQTTSNTVVQNYAPIAPPPPPTQYGTVPSVAPTVPAYSLDPYTQQAPQKKRGAKPLLIAGIVIALVLVIGIVVAGVSIIGNSTTTNVKSTSTPTYPMLAAAYAGNVHNNTVNITSTFTLTNVVEDAQGNISGNAGIAAPLAGSGPFKGTVSTNKSIQFTITPNDNSGVSTIRCIGTVGDNGSLSGNYTVTNTGETGTWQAK